MESDVKEDKPECPWKVEEENEERYNFSDEKGLWQPKPEDILSMFDQLAKGGALPLQWTCPGRRPPEAEQDPDKREETGMEVDEQESREEESREPEPCAFDFDDTQSEGSMKTTPMRTLGGPGRTPRTEKRVARMDNIMDSLRKQQLQRAAEREARKAKASPGRTPQGRGRLLKFGSPLGHGSKKSENASSKTFPAPVTAIATSSSSSTAVDVAKSQPAVPAVSSDPPNSSYTTEPATSVVNSGASIMNHTNNDQNSNATVKIGNFSEREKKQSNTGFKDSPAPTTMYDNNVKTGLPVASSSLASAQSTSGAEANYSFTATSKPVETPVSSSSENLDHTAVSTTSGPSMHFASTDSHPPESSTTATSTSSSLPPLSAASLSSHLQPSMSGQSLKPDSSTLVGATVNSSTVASSSQPVPEPATVTTPHVTAVPSNQPSSSEMKAELSSAPLTSQPKSDASLLPSAPVQEENIVAKDSM